ncbi:MAG: lipase secretion chaperone [Arenimonas sp.]
MSKTRSVVLSVAVLGIATLSFFWYSKRPVAESVNQETAAVAGTDSLNGQQASASNKHSMPPDSMFSLEKSSLRGTEVDGGIVLGTSGKVLLDPGMRRLFDYYLSLMGEQNLLQIRSLLKEYLLGKYSPANTDEALKYFDRYTDYLNALTDLNIGGLSQPEERLEKVTALRKKMLGEEMAFAFFAEEEMLAVLTLKRMAINNNKSLSAEEKARQLAALDASEHYSARTEADTAALVTEQTEQLETLKLTDAQRAEEREALWGKEAASRLAELDQQRARWDTRIDQYLLARSRIDANRGLSQVARERAITALRMQHFNASEQRRVASLEAIGQLKPGG